MVSLDIYKKKRDFLKTPEPKGRVAGILSKNFLVKNYVYNKKSISEIARLTNKDWATAKRHLLLNRIKPRTHKEQAAISSPGRKFKYLPLLTEEFFKKNYIEKKKSIVQISEETGINLAVIRRYMKRLNIEVRSSTEQKRISHPMPEFVISEDCFAFLDGLLLGDGSIPYNKYERGFPYTQGCKYREYLEYLRGRLSKFGISSSPILTKWIEDKRCKNGGYQESYLQTHRYKTFKKFRQRWYKDGKKIIPRDFNFTPDSLLQFYLCDGNFYREIRLCMGGFNIEDVKFFRQLLIKNLNITSRLINTPSMNGCADLAIRNSETAKFLSYIEDCPVKCYEYKWHNNEPVEKKIERNKKAKEIYHLKKTLDLRL